MFDENVDKERNLKPRHRRVGKGGAQGKRKLISPETPDGHISRCGKWV